MSFIFYYKKDNIIVSGLKGSFNLIIFQNLMFCQQKKDRDKTPADAKSNCRCHYTYHQVDIRRDEMGYVKPFVVLICYVCSAALYAGKYAVQRECWCHELHPLPSLMSGFA